MGTAKQKLTADQREILALIEEREYRQQYEKAESYVALPRQEEFHRSDAHQILVYGSNRSGKTRSCAQEVYWRMIGEHPFKEVPKPPVYWRVSGSGWEEHVEKVLVEAFREITPRRHLKDNKFNYSDKGHKLEFKNGGWIEFTSFDQDPAKVAGRKLHGWWADESFNCPTRFRDQCLARLVDYDGPAILSLCAEEGISWEYEWYEKAMGANPDPDYAAFHMLISDNPHVSEKGKKRLWDRLQGDPTQLAIRWYGEFIAIGGLIFPMLDQQFHVKHVAEVISAKELPPFEDWGKFIAIDPAESKPHAVIWGAVAPGGHIHIYRELLQAGTIPDLCRRIRAESGLEHISAFYIDPHWDWTNLAARSVADGVSPLNFHSEFQKCGIELIKAPRGKSGSVDLGLDLVKRKLQVDPINLLPNMTFSHETPTTFKHMKYYMYKPQKNVGDERKVSKVNDDLPDCIRILVTSDPQFEDSLRFCPINLTSQVVYDEEYGTGF